jgi:hypothetical protein
MGADTKYVHGGIVADQAGEVNPAGKEIDFAGRGSIQ